MGEGLSGAVLWLPFLFLCHRLLFDSPSNTCPSQAPTRLTAEIIPWLKEVSLGAPFGPIG
jgi:hypothetical protein